MFLLEVENIESRRAIAFEILTALPEWFGIEKEIQKYVEGVEEGFFFSIENSSSEPIGFLCLKENSKIACEIYVMGILRTYHNQGFGKELVVAAKNKSQENHKIFLLVKTLSTSKNNQLYRKTYDFYIAQGFKKLEELPTLWDETNPCVNLIYELNP